MDLAIHTCVACVHAIAQSGVTNFFAFADKNSKLLTISVNPSLVFISCSKNSIGVYHKMERKKKATILCIENCLYIKVM